MGVLGVDGWKNTASSSVEHVVEVTAKRRLFFVTSVTDIPDYTVKIFRSLDHTVYIYVILCTRMQRTTTQEEKRGNKHKLLVRIYDTSSWWFSASLTT